jgi:hypothetical protein
MAPEPISTAFFINPSHKSVCLYLYPLIVARQRLGKKLPQQRIYTQQRIVVGVVSYAVRVVSGESRRLVLPRTNCLYLEVRNIY